jgi:uncharacterized protein (TIGR00645 family)
MTPPAPVSISTSDAPIELVIERSLFAMRWLLAPIYLGLAASLFVVLFKFAQRTVGLFSNLLAMDPSTTTIEVLSLLELSFLASLILTVMFAGYRIFVSARQFPGDAERPDWIRRVGFSELKLRLIASLVVIAAIQLLEDFMDIANTTNRELAWTVGITLTFVGAGVLLAVMERVSPTPRR